MDEYISRYEAQFGLEASPSLSPWLRYHRDDARGLLVLSRPYYADFLVQHLASSDHGADLRRLKEREEWVIVMDAISEQNPYSTCGDFVCALERVIRAD
jgi:hypothetical protein